jgi:hypothetical protein
MFHNLNGMDKGMIQNNRGGKAKAMSLILLILMVRMTETMASFVW